MASYATVAASDGGEITVTLLPDTHMAPDTYYKVIGSVVNSTKLKMRHCIPMGTDLDMKLVDDTIKLIHDQRFFNKIHLTLTSLEIAIPPAGNIYDPFSLLESFTRAPVPRALYLGAADPGARILRVAFPVRPSRGHAIRALPTRALPPSAVAYLRAAPPLQPRYLRGPYSVAAVVLDALAFPCLESLSLTTRERTAPMLRRCLRARNGQMLQGAKTCHGFQGS
ncbi:hypothetical protein DFH09DRAFT_1460576 [Mycena vulgaris]|nr:hypothetical protein DFH09DRAFT_1460576 [Mycena vulgaris]